MFKHYFITAIRNLLKYRTQNIISILGLAVGILCFTVCLYISRFGTEINKHFDNYDRIGMFELDSKTYGRYSNMSPLLVQELRAKNLYGVETLTSVVGRRKYTFNVQMRNDELLPYELCFLEVDTCYNTVFTPEIVAGSWEVVSNTQNSIVMNRSTALHIFGSVEEAVGRQLISTRRRSTAPKSRPKDGGISYTIQAVMEDLPLNCGFSFMEELNMLIVNDSEGAIANPTRGFGNGGNYALLAPNTDIDDFQEQLNKVMPKYRTNREDCTVHIIKLADDTYQGIDILGIVISTIGSLILLVGFINFFHFLIGSFLNRSKEHSLRKLLGSSKQSLFLQLFIETMLVVGCAALLLMWLLEVFTPCFNFTTEDVIMRFDRSTLYLHALQYLGLIVLLCAVVCWLTVLRIRHLSVQAGLFGGNRRRGKQRGRNILLGVQFFICWLFMGSTVWLYLQVDKIGINTLESLSKQEKQEILSIPFDYPSVSHADKLAMVDRFKQSSGIKDILLSDIAYTRGISGDQLTYELDGKEWTDWIDVVTVPHNFFSFMNLPIEQGRLPQSKNDMVVDQLLQAYWQKRGEILGQHFNNGAGQHYTVCGICAPYRRGGLNQSDGKGTAFIYFDPNIYVGHCYLKCHPGRVEEVKQWVEDIRREMLPRSIDPAVGTLQEEIEYNLQIFTSLANVILFFAVVCIVITLLGVYSSITLDTQRRRKEVAIRKINGAGIRQIMMLFARLYIILLVVSSVIAFPLIYVMATYVKEKLPLFYEVNIFFWIGLFLGIALITFLTVIFRIMQIARQNPAEVIKSE